MFTGWDLRVTSVSYYGREDHKTIRENSRLGGVVLLDLLLLLAVATFGCAAEAALDRFDNRKTDHAAASLTVTTTTTETATTASDRSLQTCYSNLTEIAALEYDLNNTNVFRTYVLCPNTVFQVADVLISSGQFINGQIPIIPRPNSLYKCGNSGASTNNCTLSAGYAGLLHFGQFGDLLLNFTIQGLTFSRLESYGAFVNHPGQMTVVDCIFQDMGNQAPVYLELGGSPFRRGLLQELRPNLRKRFHNSDRNMASVVLDFSSDLSVSFVNCVFRNNFYGGALANAGVISATQGPNSLFLSVESSLFINNTFEEDDGYAILADASVTVKSNCFIDNRFAGFGPVQVYNFNSIDSSNNFGPLDPVKLYCSFLSVLDRNIFSEFPVVGCLPYEATRCSFALPVAGPTHRPTRRPTKRPSRRPTKRPTRRPIRRPTRRPTRRPSRHPTRRPTN